MKFPSIDEFQRLPRAEQDRIRAAMAAETAELAEAVQEREAQLHAAGADWDEICRDMRGDRSVAEKYGLPTGSTEEA